MKTNLPFPNRIRSRADIRSKLPLIPAKPESLKEHMLSEQASKDGCLLYIHIPFCSQICDFCGYTKIVNTNVGLTKKYMQNINSHIETLSGYSYISNSKIKAIYLGGGSPGNMPEEYISTIINTCREKLDLDKKVEITCELTFAEINENKLRKLKQAGINRLSLGLQSFNTALRQKLGRKSDFEKIIEKINLIESSDFKNVYVDLIYNIQDQTLNNWTGDVDFLGKLPINGSSIYPLVNFPNSKIGKLGLWKEPDMNLEWQFYSTAHNFFMDELNWKCFTPVQFGDDENGSSTYITGIAQNADIIALGNSGGGRIGPFQYLVNPEIKSYTENENLDFFETIRLFSFQPEFLPFKKILELPESTALDKSVAAFAIEKLHSTITGLEEKKLITETDFRYELTLEGKFWAGNISDLLIQEVNNMI